MVDMLIIIDDDKIIIPLELSSYTHINHTSSYTHINHTQLDCLITMLNHCLITMLNHSFSTLHIFFMKAE